MAWDVNVLNTFAESRLISTAAEQEDKPEVATAAVAPNGDATECSAIKIHDLRLVKLVTNLNVYVPPI